MITHAYPRRARPFVTRNVFQATFNAPTVGRYDFAVAANTGASVLALRARSLYLVDVGSVGADISPEVYQEAQDPASLLVLQFYTKKTKSPVPDNPVPVVQLFESRPMGFYFVTDAKDGDELIVDVRGALLQPAAIIGKPTVALSLSLSIYTTSDPAWIEAYVAGGATTGIPGKK